MLRSISLKFSEAPTELVVPSNGVTVFVGPNNAGKSLVLREVQQLANDPRAARKIVGQIELNFPELQDFEQELEALAIAHPGSDNEYLQLARFNAHGARESQRVLRAKLVGYVREKQVEAFVTNFYKFFILRLDGRTRFALTDERERGDLLAPPSNFFTKIFVDDALRSEIRSVCLDALGVNVVLDPTNGNELRIRLSPTPPSQDEQSLNAEARAFHAAAQPIKEASDGIQAFIGIVMAAFAADYRIVLIDEPEAFLHPPLARKLGHQLAARSAKRGTTLFAATHSADFLMGCLQGTHDVRVVRLEHSKGKSKGKLVDTQTLRQFFGNPLIRNSNVISGLFHDGVIVTESDNDRAFYAEIYHRITEVQKDLPSILFVNAQNKQTIRNIIGPLRTFGVPAAAIVDIDILKDGGEDWTGWLSSAQVPKLATLSLGQYRSSVKQAFEKRDLDMKRDGGASQLDETEAEAAENLFDTLDAYGVFVVRRGELEAWLPRLAATGRKTDWTISALEKMGNDPSSAAYVRPAEDDVWAFLRNIAAWIGDPSRRGTR